MDLAGVPPSSDEGLMGRKHSWSFFSWPVACCPHYSFRGVSDLLIQLYQWLLNLCQCFKFHCLKKCRNTERTEGSVTSQILNNMYNNNVESGDRYMTLVKQRKM